MSGDLCCPGRPTIPRDICCLVTNVARSCKVNGADDEGATRGRAFPGVGGQPPPSQSSLRASTTNGLADVPVVKDINWDLLGWLLASIC